jgi:hypothetical protein
MGRPVVHDLASVNQQTMTAVFQEQHNLGDPVIGSPTALDTSVWVMSKER